MEQTNHISEARRIIYAFKLYNRFRIVQDITIRKLFNYITYVNKLQKRPEYKPLYAANLIDIVNPNEPQISQILCCIFNYQQDGKFIVTYDFIERFLVKYGFDINLIEHPCVAAEECNIDVLIREKGKYSIILENKIKGATFQRNQLARYIQKQINYGYNETQIYVILLPLYDEDNYINYIPKSVWKLPSDWEKNNNERRCSIEGNSTLCWCDEHNRVLSEDEKLHCKCCKNFSNSFIERTVVLKDNLPDWIDFEIQRNRISEKETILLSSMNLLSDYLNGLFGRRINNKMLMSIIKFLEEELFKENLSIEQKKEIVDDTFEGIQAISKGLEKLKNEIIPCEFINEWYNNLIAKGYDIKKEDYKSKDQTQTGKCFYGLINNIKIGCWSGWDNNNSPYWGFQTQNEDKPSSEQENFVMKFFPDEEWHNYHINNKNKDNEKDKGWIIWNSTWKGDDECERFYKRAKELDILGK